MIKFQIFKATREDLETAKKWKEERLEERTCRPVVNGKRLPPSNDVVTLSFLLDDYEQPAGFFSYFNYNPRNRSCEIGYKINPEIRNKGLGTVMLRACIDNLFSDSNLNLNKIYCQTAEFNLPSVRILEKLGFTSDGVLREHHELDGKLFNDYLYSILKSEWHG